MIWTLKIFKTTITIAVFIICVKPVAQYQVKDFPLEVFRANQLQ